MHNYQSILVAVDFSEHSEVALARACQMARNYDASIEVLHVVELPTYPVLEDVAVMGLPGVWDTEITEKVTTSANQKLSKMVKEAGLDENRAKVVNGIASDEIVSRAKTIAADLVVMGKYGLSGWKRLLGSTTDGVMHHANCDVLAVKID